MQCWICGIIEFCFCLLKVEPEMFLFEQVILGRLVLDYPFCEARAHYGPLSSMAAFHGNTYKVNWLVGNRKPYYRPRLEIGLWFKNNHTFQPSLRISPGVHVLCAPFSPWWCSRCNKGGRSRLYRICQVIINSSSLLDLHLSMDTCAQRLDLIHDGHVAKLVLRLRLDEA